MTRYVVEYRKTSGSYLLHQRLCQSWPGVDLLTLARMIDLGVHADFNSAFRMAREDYRAQPCFFCCPRHCRDGEWRPDAGPRQLAAGHPASLSEGKCRNW